MSATAPPDPRPRSWIDRFELAPSSASNIPELDGLRAVAVLSVFLRHAWGLSGQPQVVIGGVDLSPLIVMMANGVDLFFVLSGFLLGRGFVAADLAGKPAPSLRRYVRSRAFRILPAYYLALIALFVFFAPMLLNPADVYSNGGTVTLASHLLVLQTINPISYGRWGIASPYWTLTIEVIFYALVPLVARCFFRRRVLVGLAASLALSLGWLWFARYSGGTVMNFIVRNSHRDGAGVEFARFFVSKQIPGYAFSFGVGLAAASLVGSAQHAATTGEAVPWHGRRSMVSSHWSLPQRLCADDAVSARPSTTRTTTASSSCPTGRTRRCASTSRNTTMAGIRPRASTGSSRPGARSPQRSGAVGRLVGILDSRSPHMPLLYLYNHIGPIATLPPGWHWLWLAAAGTATVAVGVFSFFVVEKPPVERGRRPIRRSRPGRSSATPPPPVPGRRHDAARSAACRWGGRRRTFLWRPP